MYQEGYTASVYVDIIILVNLIMDFFILWCAGKIGNLRVKFTRIFFGALLGASYSLVIFFPEWPFLTSLFMKILCSVLMLALAYAPIPLGRFLRSLAYLYFISFVMGGAVIGVMYLTNNSPGHVQVFNGVAVVSGEMHYGWLTVGLGAALLLGTGGISYLRRNWLEQTLLLPVTLTILGHTLNLQGFVDTGNQLQDPLTKRPVLVLEIQVLKRVLPPAFYQEFMLTEEQNLPQLTSFLDQQWSGRLVLIPFNSVGKKNGLLLGFRPDYVEIRSKGKSYVTSEVILGLVSRSLSKEGKYQALLQPELLK